MREQAEERDTGLKDGFAQPAGWSRREETAAIFVNTVHS